MTTDSPTMEHFNHGFWEQIGHCVYCSCGARLYQGKLPKTPQAQKEMAEALDALWRQYLTEPTLPR